MSVWQLKYRSETSEGERVTAALFVTIAIFVPFLDRIFLIGGDSKEGSEASDAVEMYRLQKDESQPLELEPLHLGRRNHAAIGFTSSKTKQAIVIVAGGRDKENRLLDSVEIYSEEKDA